MATPSPLFSDSCWAPLLHPTKNAGKQFNRLTQYSNVTCSFICQHDAGRATGHCGFEWTDKLANMTRKTVNPCPHCRQLKPVFCGENNCALCVNRSVIGPKLAKYKWIVDRNLDDKMLPLNPVSISAYSNKCAWFTCPGCDKGWWKQPSDLATRPNQVCLECYSKHRNRTKDVEVSLEVDVVVGATSDVEMKQADVPAPATSGIETPAVRADPIQSSSSSALPTRKIYESGKSLQIHNAMIEWLVPLLENHPGVTRVERSGWNGGLQMLVLTTADQQYHPLMLSVVGKQTNNANSYNLKNNKVMIDQSQVRKPGAVVPLAPDVVPLYHPEQVRFGTNNERSLFVVARLKDMCDPDMPFATVTSFTPVRTNASKAKRLWYQDPPRIFTEMQVAINRLVAELVGSRVMTQAELGLTVQTSLRQEVLQHNRLIDACRLLNLTCRRESVQFTTVDVLINNRRVQMKLVGKAVNGLIVVRSNKRDGFKKGADGKNTTMKEAPYDENDFDALVVECEELPGRFCVLPMKVLVEQGKVTSERLGRMQCPTQFRILVPDNSDGETDWATPYWDQLGWFQS